MDKFKITQRGIDFIKNHEIFIEKAYKRNDDDKFYTIGYGHRDEDVSKCLEIIEAQAERILNFYKFIWNSKILLKNMIKGLILI